MTQISLNYPDQNRRTDFYAVRLLGCHSQRGKSANSFHLPILWPIVTKFGTVTCIDRPSEPGQPLKFQIVTNPRWGTAAVAEM